MTPETITARTAAHQRARILRDAAWTGWYRATGTAHTLAMEQAARRQERIGNGEEG